MTALARRSAPCGAGVTAGAWAVLLLGLSGCGALVSIGPGGPPPRRYALQLLAAPSARTRHGGAPLGIGLPVAPPSLDRVAIAVKPSPLELAALPASVWADRPARMLQDLLVDAAERAGLDARRGDVVADDGAYTLATELRTLQLERVPGGASLVRVRIAAQVARTASGRVVASRRFEATETPAGTDTPALLGAFNQAANAVLAELIPWVRGALVGPREQARAAETDRETPGRR